MPNWNQILNEVVAAGSTHDLIRRKYLSELNQYTGRNVIIYYSGWLQKRELASNSRGFAFSINDEDKTGFMSCVHGMDRSKGLDLLLHTPGGEIAATESLVQYLKSMFDGDIRVIVPELALSAGTMIACSAKEIVMGSHSSLGPIDPQYRGLPAHGVIEEVERAKSELSTARNQTELIARQSVWQPIIAKYNPTLIGECEKSIKWSNEMVKEWLTSCMLKDDENASQKAEEILIELGDHAMTKSHDRHISKDKAKSIGLKIIDLETDQELQEKVLSVHHSTIQTLSSTPSIKIIENQMGIAFINNASPLLFQQGKQ